MSLAGAGTSNSGGDRHAAISRSEVELDAHRDDRRGGCRVATTAPSPKRARSTASRAAEAGAGGDGRARRARPGPAAQPVEPRFDRDAFAEHLLRQGVEIGEVARRPAASSARLRPAPSAPARACCRAASKGEGAGARDRRAGRRPRRTHAPARRRRHRPRSRAGRKSTRPPRPARAERRSRRRKPAARRQGATAIAARRARVRATVRPAAAGHRSTRSRASVSRSTSFDESRERPSRQTWRASSVLPSFHSTSPRCAAISGSGRA